MLCAFMPLANTVEKQNKTSEWYAKDISKKVKTGIKTKGMSGKPIVTEAPYGYRWDDENPRIQLEPRGQRGYIELRAVRRVQK